MLANKIIAPIVNTISGSITRRRFTTVILLIFTVFLITRLVNLNRGYIWFDDTASVGPLGQESFTQIFSYGWQQITGPLVPTLIYWLIVRLFGPNLIILRLVPISISVLSLFIFYRFILKKLLTSELAILGVLLAMCFSIPVLVYSQALQPAIFYFFSGVILCAVFIRLFVNRTNIDKPVLNKITNSKFTHHGNIRFNRHLIIFGLIAVSVFFSNYLSVLVYFGLLGALFLSLLSNVRLHRQQSGNLQLVRSLLKSCLVALVSSLPLLLLIYLRLHSGESNIRSYFAGSYYISGPFDVFRLSYDALTYVFNFSYLPQIYQPLGLNPVSIPFVLIVCFGAVQVLQKIPGRGLIVIFFYFTILIVGVVKIAPLGGVRHTLTIAPFLFLGFGFGVEYLEEWFTRRQKLVSFWKIAGLLIIFFAPLLFLCTALNYYSDRSYRLDPTRIAGIAQQYNIKTIYESEAFGPLVFYDQLQGNPIKNSGIRLAYFDEYACPATDNSYLLVAYRDKLDPNWPFPIIPEEDDCLKKFTVTPRWEDPGALDPNTTVQSIYFPVNGNFVYLLSPRKIELFY